MSQPETPHVKPQYDSLSWIMQSVHDPGSADEPRVNRYTLEGLYVLLDGTPWGDEIGTVLLASDEGIDALQRAKEVEQQAINNHGLPSDVPVDRVVIDERPSHYEHTRAQDLALSLDGGSEARRELLKARNTLVCHGIDPTTSRPAHQFRFGSARREIREAQEALGSDLGFWQQEGTETARRVSEMVTRFDTPEWRRTAPVQELINAARLLNSPTLQAAYSAWARTPFPTHTSRLVAQELRERVHVRDENLTVNRSGFDLSDLGPFTRGQLIRAHDDALNAQAPAARPSSDLLRDLHRLSSPSAATTKDLPALDLARASLSQALSSRTGVTTWYTLEQAVSLRSYDPSPRNGHLTNLLDQLDHGEILPAQFAAAAVSGNPDASQPTHTLGWTGTFEQILNATYTTFGDEGFGGLGGQMYVVDPTYDVHDGDNFNDSVTTYSINDRPLAPGEIPNAEEMQAWIGCVTPDHLTADRISVQRDGDTFTVTIRGTQQEVNPWATHLSETSANHPSQIRVDDFIENTTPAHKAPAPDLDVDLSTGSRAR